MIRGNALSFVVLAAVLVVTTSCSPRSRSPLSAMERAERAESYWGALQSLDVRTAARAAPDEEHRLLAEAMRLSLEGRAADAATSLERLQRGASDEYVRRASRAALVSTLAYLRDWDALYELLHDAPASTGASALDAASVLAWASAMRTAAPPSFVSLPKPVTVPLRFAATGVPIISVRVNGCQRWFWLDTGSSTTLVPSDVADGCGVKPVGEDGLEVVTATGRITARPAVIDSFAIGALGARNLPAAIVSASELTLRSAGSVRSERIHGVIGFDLLREYDVDLDYVNGRASFRESGSRILDRARERNLYWLGFPAVSMRDARGRRVLLGLDTGADASFVTPSLMARIPARLLARQVHTIAGFGSDTTMRLQVLVNQRFRVHERLVGFDSMAVREVRRLLFVPLDGMLGADIGGLGRVRIDMRAGLFVVTDTL